MTDHILGGATISPDLPLSTQIENLAALAAAIAEQLEGIAVDGPLTDDELRAAAIPMTLDGEAVVLGAGTATIGKLGANSGVDIGDVDATANNTLSTVSATIAESGSLSAEVDIGSSKVLCGIIMPAAWTAAGMTFQAAAATGGTFYNLYDAYGTEKALTVAAERYIPIDDPAFWLGVRYLKVRSGTAASAVNQAAARTITLVTKPI